MGDVRKQFEALREVSQLVDAETFDAILSYMDETECSYIRIEKSLGKAERQLQKQDEDLGTIEHVWLWQRTCCEDEYHGEIFIPLPDSRFLAFGFHSS